MCGACKPGWGCCRGECLSSAGVSASLLQAPSQSCQQVGAQLTCLPAAPSPACRHNVTSADLQMPDNSWEKPIRGKVRRAVAEVRQSKALHCTVRNILCELYYTVRNIYTVLCAILTLYCAQYLSCQWSPEMMRQMHDSAP